MAIIVKSADELQKMRIAGRLTGDVLNMLEKMIAPGITTRELNNAADSFIRERAGIPSFLNYRGFPGSACISLNEQVIHGLPGSRKLKNGDIVSVDIGAIVDGYHGDAARTFLCGECSEEAKRLVQITRQSFFEGIKYAKHGLHLSQISKAIQDYVESNGFSVVRDWCGHGIGKNLHEDPSVPNYKQLGRGPRLLKGMTLAIEPMVNEGTYEVKVLSDNWTVVTKDGKLSAHYENTIAITDGEPEIFTIE